MVVLPSDLFEAEAYRQLNDGQCYWRLEGNPTECFKNKIDNILLEAFNKGVISKLVLDGLR